MEANKTGLPFRLAAFRRFVNIALYTYRRPSHERQIHVKLLLRQ